MRPCQGLDPSSILGIRSRLYMIEDFNNPDNFTCYPLWKNTERAFLSNDTDTVSNPTFNEAVSYKINAQGFRGEDFNNVELITLGCSMTFGVGLNQERIWPSIVSNSLSLSLANISKPSGSPDTCFRFASYWVPKLKPKYLVYLQPPPGRFEILKSKTFSRERDPGIFTVDAYKQTRDYYEIYRSWLSNDLNNELSYNKNYLAIKQLCYENNIHFLYYSAIDYDKTNPLDCARDGIHPGIRPSEVFAQKVINDIRGFIK